MAGKSESSESLVDRARGEYVEMPGLRLTVSQAARLWAVPVDESARVLDALAERGFLCLNDQGMFVRRGRCPRCS